MSTSLSCELSEGQVNYSVRSGEARSQSPLSSHHNSWMVAHWQMVWEWFPAETGYKGCSF